MSRIAYVNGRYLPLAQACVNVEDRGYQFSDGVYEVCEVRGGKLIDERRHIARLERSLSELRIAMVMVTGASEEIARQTLALYFEPDRGVVPRQGEINVAGLAQVIAFLAEGRVIKSRPPPERFIDLQYLKAAGVE